MSVVVAIDGPSGAGKSTVGHALAQRIDATFVDTGLMYRALTLAALERDVDLENGSTLGGLAAMCLIEVERPRQDQTDRLETVLLDGRDVTLAVREPQVDRAVSAVSRHAEVRDAMLGVQRATAFLGDVVMVGRDIGTVVLPDATLKVYLTAVAEVRAARRAAEMGAPDRLETVLLDGRDVTLAVREPQVDRAVSAVSRHAEVRDAMLGVQRATAFRGDVVMVGRDIGTVVLPDATLKVYLTAAAEVRAARRAAEMGAPDRLGAYLDEIRRRDAADSGREVAPLRIPEGALVLDTGELDVDACVDAIISSLEQTDA